MANEFVGTVNDQASQSGGFDYSYLCFVGNFLENETDGALRFTDINIPNSGSINEAYLIYKYETVGTAESGRWTFDVYGIDEDDTAEFTSNPFGRAETTATVAIDDGGPPTEGGSKTINVKAILEEITSRAGWESGNAVGFFFKDNGSDDEVWAEAHTEESYLIYRLTAEPNFFPTPGTVSAPTFPDDPEYGLKISAPGIDVGTADTDDLWFTSARKVLKVSTEGTSGFVGGTATFNHFLGYQPMALGYLMGTAGEKMFKLNKGIDPNFADPLEDGDVTGYLSIGTADVKVLSQIGTLCYTYVFLDELN